MRNYNPLDLDAALPSYWASNLSDPVQGERLESDMETDIAIIGAGYTGLSTAYHLARDYGIKALVLDAGPIGYGCSGRNGGFVSISIGKTDLKAWINEYGLDQAKAILDQGRDAVRLVRRLLTDENIEAEASLDGGLELAHKPNRLAGLEAYCKLLTERFDVPAKILSKSDLEREFLNSREAHGALLYGEGFALHAAKYVDGLAKAARRLGATLHSYSRVTGWRWDGKAHILATPNGTLKARQVVVAGNGYTGDRLHPALSGRTLPVLSNIIVTRPLSDTERANVAWQTHLKIWDSRNLLFYYRLLPDNRILFGARGGIFDTDKSRRERRAWLEHRLGQMFPPLREIGSEYFWNGWVCITRDRYPRLGSTDKGTVHYALGYIGNGVALATYCGKLLAARVADDARLQPSPVLAKKLPLFPAPSLRRLYQRGIYSWFEFQDRFL